MFEKNKKYLLIATPIFACLLIYAQTLSFEYVWDDIIIFLNKNSLTAEPLSWSLITTPVLEGTSYMRPAILFTWWLEFKLFGQNPVISHAINVLFFSINVVLIQTIATRLINKKNPASSSIPATLAALIYAIHPALIESTTWVSGRFDLMCTTGILSATLVYLYPSKNIFLRYIMLGTSLFLALFSKELGVITPVILFCIGMAYHSDTLEKTEKNILNVFKREPLLWVYMSLIIFSYFISRKLSMPEMYHQPIEAAYLWNTIKTLEPIEALYRYIILIIYPFDSIGIYHTAAEYQTKNILFYLNIIFTLAVSAATIWCALVRQTSWAWILLGAGVGLSLVLHFIPMTIGVNIIQDRFITTSLAFFCIALVVFPWNDIIKKIESRYEIKIIKLAYSLVVFWIIFATLTTLTTIPMWKSDLLLWGWTLEKNPKIEDVRTNYINSAILANRVDLAKKEIEKILVEKKQLSINQKFSHALILMGENNPESIKYFKEIIDIVPKKIDNSVDINKIKEIEKISLIAATYKYYALAILAFDNNISEAKISIEIADKLTSKEEKGFIYFSKAAIYYASNEFTIARSLEKSGNDNYFYNQESAKKQMNEFLKAYCLWAKPDQIQRLKVCKKLSNSVIQ